MAARIYDLKNIDHQLSYIHVREFLENSEWAKFVGRQMAE